MENTNELRVCPLTNRRICPGCWNGIHFVRKGKKMVRACFGGDCQCLCREESKKKPKPN